MTSFPGSAVGRSTPQQAAGPGPQHHDRGYWALPNGQRCLVFWDEADGNLYAIPPTGRGRWWLARIPSRYVLDVILHGWADAVAMDTPLRWVEDRVARWNGLDADVFVR